MTENEFLKLNKIRIVTEKSTIIDDNEPRDDGFTEETIFEIEGTSDYHSHNVIENIANDISRNFGIKNQWQNWIAGNQTTQLITGIAHFWNEHTDIAHKLPLWIVGIKTKEDEDYIFKILLDLIEKYSKNQRKKIKE